MAIANSDQSKIEGGEQREIKDRQWQYKQEMELMKQRHTEDIELVKQRQAENDERFNILLEEVRYLIRGNQED